VTQGWLGAFAVAALLTGCAARPATSPTAPPDIAAAGSGQQLVRELDTLFGAPSVDHVQWGVSFYSVRDDRSVFALNPTRFLIPASNQKLLITSAAAERLGWDYRFTTRLLASGPIRDDGALDGDLIVVGNGDPTINTRDSKRWRVFDDWAAALKARGITSITGRLIGDDNAFAEPGWGVGWAWDNLQYGYGAQATALQFNENQVEVLVGPGMSPGTPAIISVSPAGGGLVIDNRVTTVAPGQPTSTDIARIPGSPHLTVRGQIALDAAPTTDFASVEDPTRYYLNNLRSALQRYGIAIGASTVDADSLDAPLAYDTLTELVVDRSPPLFEIIDIALKWSRNIYAESMLVAMSPDMPASGSKGLRAVGETLQSWGIPAEGYLSRDGSGLSRYDYVSANTLIAVLRHMLGDSRHVEKFQAALAEAGGSGTLTNRLKGTPAEGRVRAKTGTLSNVRSLAGYATTLDGDTIVFAMMANNFRVSAAEIDAIMERAIIRAITASQTGRTR
jgi:D-alanyl-D-alanine carboxypeptidase/D-alanyl-D-alanine-endopeptidase (penicillin-binding protein 4)